MMFELKRMDLDQIDVTPYFSIIIPVYNVAPYLRECLDSVMGQTFQDWETICINDGSTDISGSILDEYAARDPRFRVIHQTNNGVSAARNRALDEIKGKWVCFLDGDDYWEEKFLGTIREMIRNYPGNNCFRVGFDRFEDGTSETGSDIKTLSVEVIDISRMISIRDFYNYYFVCYVYQCDLFDGIRFPHYIRGEDRCVLNRLQLQRIDAIVETECPLYRYRNRSGSAMNSIPSSQVLRDEMDHRLDIMEMIDKSHKKVDYAGNDWLEKYFTRCIYQIIKTRGSDRREVLSDWRDRLRRLRRVKGLSLYGRFVAWTCSVIHCQLWDSVVCYMIPRLLEGGSVFRYVKRKLGFVSNDVPQVS